MQNYLRGYSWLDFSLKGVGIAAIVISVLDLVGSTIKAVGNVGKAIRIGITNFVKKVGDFWENLLPWLFSKYTER